MCQPAGGCGDHTGLANDVTSRKVAAVFFFFAGGEGDHLVSSLLSSLRDSRGFPLCWQHDLPGRRGQFAIHKSPGGVQCGSLSEGLFLGADSGAGRLLQPHTAAPFIGTGWSKCRSRQGQLGRL